MRNMCNYLPVYLLLLYALGILVQFYFSIFSGHLQGICVTVLFFSFSRFFLKGVELFVFFFLGMYMVYVLQNPAGHYKNLESKSGDVVLKIHAVLKANKTTKPYLAEVCFFDSVKATGKLLLKIERDSGAYSLEIGDFLIARTRIDKLPINRNIYGFDYGDYLKKKNIQGQIFLKKKDYNVQKSNSFGPRKLAERQRLFLKNKLRNTIKDREVVAVTEAMLLGDKSQISRQVLKNYASAGVIHVLAISGLHVGILLWLLNFIYRPLLLFEKGKYIRSILLIISLWAFALLVGMSPSVVRAVTMFSFVGMALYLSHRITVLRSLVSSAFVLLLCDPFFIFDVGFQLSYLAVGCIVVLQPLLVRFWKPRHKVLAWFWNLLTVSLAAQIGVMPLSLYYFHQFPSLFLLSNLVVVPCIGVLLSLGLFVLLLSLVGGHFSVLIFFYSQTVLLLNRFIAWVALQEAYLFENVFFPGVYVWVSYASLILGIVFLKTKKRQIIMVFAGSVFFFLLLHRYVKKENRQKEEFVVFYKYKSSLFLRKMKGQLEVFENSKSKGSLFLKDYLRENFPVRKVRHLKIKDFYEFQKKKILVIDSMFSIKWGTRNADVLILKDSPKLNLERLVLKTGAKQVVVDGSNYPFYKKRWRKTCQKMDVDYHDTSVKGAYVLK